MSDETARAPEGLPATRPTPPRVTVMVAPRTLWLAAAIGLGLLGVLFVFTQALGVIIVFFIAVIVAEGIRPLVDWLGSRHVPRPLGVLAIYLAIFIVLGGLAYILVQPLINQFGAFVNALPDYIADAQRLLGQAQRLAAGNSQVARAIQLLESQVGNLLSQGVPLLLQLPLALGGLVFDAIIVLVMAFFWLTGIERLRPFVLGLLPEQARPVGDAVIADFGRKLGGYLRGVLINMVLIGGLSGVGLWILGVPYPVLLGMLTGLTEIIPFFGPWISGPVAVLVAGFAVGPLKAVEVIILYMVLQQVAGSTLQPIVMHHTVELNPLLVIVAVLIGGALFGIAGSVLSVPLAALIEVVVVRVLAPTARHASSRVEVRHAARDDTSDDASEAPPTPPTPPAMSAPPGQAEPTEPTQPTQPTEPHVPAPT